MAHLQRISLEHIPSSYAVYVALYKNVTNAPYLREQLISGNSTFEYAFIDACTILTPSQALTAAFRAIRTYEASLSSPATKKLTTRNIHSETVFCLSPSNNITDSFRRFGISDGTTSLLVIKITHDKHASDNVGHEDGGEEKGVLTKEEISQHLQDHVKGEEVEFCEEEVRKLTDVDKVVKYYKIVGGSGAGGGKGMKAERDMEVDILGAMALRGT